MGAKTHEIQQKDGTHYAWLVWCPACDQVHTFDKRWSFNGDHEKPSFQASMLAYQAPGRPRCHSFLTDGVWHYLADSTHAMAGKNVPAPDWASTRWGHMNTDGVVFPRQ
jgi:hypothetical protein